MGLKDIVVDSHFIDQYAILKSQEFSNHIVIFESDFDSVGIELKNLDLRHNDMLSIQRVLPNYCIGMSLLVKTPALQIK